MRGVGQIARAYPPPKWGGVSPSMAQGAGWPVAWRSCAYTQR